VLKTLAVVKCNKLKSVFPISMSKELTKLEFMLIRDADELEEIFKSVGDIENAMSSKTCCFPVLKCLAVVKCNKLKSVFPISSMSKKFPKLEAIITREADVLEEIFKSVGDDDHKVQIPKLRLVVFVNLPSLCHVQRIQFQAIKIRFVQNCEKLSLTSMESDRDIFLEFLDKIFIVTGDLGTHYTQYFSKLLHNIQSYLQNKNQQIYKHLYEKCCSNIHCDASQNLGMYVCLHMHTAMVMSLVYGKVSLIIIMLMNYCLIMLINNSL
jgi:hypothetical protein